MLAASRVVNESSVAACLEMYSPFDGVAAALIVRRCAWIDAVGLRARPHAVGVFSPVDVRQ